MFMQSTGIGTLRQAVAPERAGGGSKDRLSSKTNPIPNALPAVAAKTTSLIVYAG